MPGRGRGPARTPRGRTSTRPPGGRSYQGRGGCQGQAESRAYYVDARQNDVGLMVDAVRSRAQRRKDPSLLIPFETMIRYNGQIGEKAHRTRKRNEQAEAEPREDTEAPVTQPTQPAQPA